MFGSSEIRIRQLSVLSLIAKRMLTFGQNFKPETSKPMQKVDVLYTSLAKFSDFRDLAIKMLTFRSLFPDNFRFSLKMLTFRTHSLFDPAILAL